MEAIITYRDTQKNKMDTAEILITQNDVNVAIRTFCALYGFPWWTYILSVEIEGENHVVKAIAEKAGVKK